MQENTTIINLKIKGCNFFKFITINIIIMEAYLYLINLNIIQSISLLIN